MTNISRSQKKLITELHNLTTILLYITCILNTVLLLIMSSNLVILT